MKQPVPLVPKHVVQLFVGTVCTIVGVYSGLHSIAFFGCYMLGLGVANMPDDE